MASTRGKVGQSPLIPRRHDDQTKLIFALQLRNADRTRIHPSMAPSRRIRQDPRTASKPDSLCVDGET
jgi:hypothetical protein